MFGLATARPEFSARKVATRRQKCALAAFGLVLLALGIWWPRIMVQVLVAWMSLGFVGGLGFRTALASMRRPGSIPARPPGDGGLPVYTVLVPLYREAEILPRLIKSLAAFDYPVEKLDIKLIVEQDDHATRAVAESQSPFETIVVPPSLPRTKPNDCVPFAASVPSPSRAWRTGKFAPGEFGRLLPDGFA